MNFKAILLPLVLAFGAFAQTTYSWLSGASPSTQSPATAPAAPASPAPIAVAFQGLKIPAGLMLFGEYNQLGTPKWTGGLGGIYPVFGSLGIYGTTIVDFLPKLATDPTTGKSFYAISTSARQGFHKTIFCTGTACVLIGGDVGPTVSESSTNLVTGTATVTVSFSTSVTATFLWQISPAFSFILPIRMLYVPNQGWNPVVEMGGVLNLQKLPPSKIAPLGSTPTVKQMRAVMRRLHLPERR